jgi:hypothetical protein
MAKLRNGCNYFCGKPGNVGIDGRIILKRILKK